MSKDLIMRKRADGTLAVTDVAGQEYLQNMPVGRMLGVTITQARNYKFHQKIICLLTFLYDTLPRVRVKIGEQFVEQQFNTFRREFIAISGHYTSDVTRKGLLRAEPQSIRYSECSEELAKTIFSDVLNKGLEKLGEIGHTMSREELDNLTNEMLRFD